MARDIPSGPVAVDSIRHGETRVNIPTSDAEEFTDPALLELRTAVYARDSSLDPQLVWRGKFDRDVHELVVDAPPIFIQEKIDPRVLVENLRRTAAAGQAEPELTLFDGFDGLDELDVVDFYRHPASWSNRMVLGDSLQVMASLAEREDLRGKVQMVYIDPPYGIKFGSNWQVSTRRRDVKDGRLEDAAREAEQIKAFRDTWELGIHSYLAYLRDRLVVARDLLTESGSVFVQIGDENVHLVRSLLDEVFGAENLVSLITMKKTTGAGSPSGTTDVLASVCDYVVWYAKDKERIKYRRIYRDKRVGEPGATQYTLRERPDGTREPGPAGPGDRAFAHDQLTSQSAGETTLFEFEYGGRRWRPGKGGWKTNLAGMQKLAAARRLYPVGNTLRFVRYLDDFPAIPLNNLWEDTITSGFGDPKVYVVQTLTRVVERCMLMCTDPGDLVLDPTCGSGTTAYVAEQWGRRWITVDTSRVALALARQRLMGARFPYYLLADSSAGCTKEAELTGGARAASPVTDEVRHGFVYERVRHVTLKSIANNTDIHEGMTREEVDRAITRHADVEPLYDRPYSDEKVVRVCGPFTVESLQPHRSLAFAQPAGSVEPAAEAAAARDAAGPTFEETIVANLSRAGIQNGRRAERILFSSVSSYPGRFLQAIGERRDEPASGERHDEPASGERHDEPAQRVGIAIGPQYGTVSAAFIKDAAREAIHAGDVGLLAVLGFAFDPQATGTAQADEVTVEASSDGFASVEVERSLGRVRVLLVRMNADLLMGEELKKTGAGNLFTVFGEPDIALTRTADGKVVVTLRGVDVYDPTTGEVRSDSTDRIALWMVDTNYNGESFFVRHCYFTGGNDPLKRLRTALAAEIDQAAWASLYQTVSRPFEPPDTGRIAVKVINDYGDEVMKVFAVD